MKYFFSDLYLEELSNVIVATDIECQTDAFLDRPASPLFIPAKSGEDVATQIEEGEVGQTNETWPFFGNDLEWKEQQFYA